MQLTSQHILFVLHKVSGKCLPEDYQLENAVQSTALERLPAPLSPSPQTNLSLGGYNLENSNKITP